AGRGGRAAPHGHRAGPGHAQGAEAGRVAYRGPRPGRAERGIRRPGASLHGAARARSRHRQRERGRDRARPSGGLLRRADRRHAAPRDEAARREPGARLDVHRRRSGHRDAVGGAMSGATRRIDTVAVLGAGTMGHGIAQVAAAAGADVHLYDVSGDAVRAGIDRVRGNLDKGIERGKVTEAERDAVLARLSGVTALAEAAAGADLIIEAAPESIELK